ncbi:hypothetical protein HanXRQr2_Chr04g0171851 [Helianthus annuus]|uniref:Uncharacterized protein n=1 Tax=Helianthus annuus TaxID=4232 RepID=A0A9K3J884_HELAN|nr:hypothetical protein HanXRQr2_Chr04g0171851 [Helianthus annuus]KAJ0931742.1 hypothetical protein HanPSC8_Chr04g0165461 [Helianthus annuus]
MADARRSLLMVMPIIPAELIFGGFVIGLAVGEEDRGASNAEQAVDEEFGSIFSEQNRMFKSEFAPDCTAGMIAYILYDKSHFLVTQDKISARNWTPDGK